MTNVDRALAYLRAIETGAPSDPFFTPDVVQREFPNRLVPSGATRDLAALRDAAERGKKVVTEQRYEVVSTLEQGDRVALEVLWTAKIAVPVGSLAAGDVMRAHFAVFLTFRGGLIAAQHNYDCFDPF
jgi:ketosteroid isomerase-like protein